jgi:protein involved in ribonucleotide reduction
MKIIDYISFENVKDFVKTEEIISSQLKSMKKEINTDYVYVSMPIADAINKQGVAHTQRMIDQICKENNKEKLFFVCQHILVNNLNFNNNLVFTPHATLYDNYIPIPHYSCNFDINFIKPWNKRKYDFSFMGDFNSHVSRQFMKQVLNKMPNSCIIDTNTWHFYSDEKTQKINKKNYIELLGETKYSLCPRGTGPSTIRIWESMAMNSHPIILSDVLKMPLELFLETQLWTFIPENTTEYIFNFENEYDNKEYWQYFSNENLYKSIVNYL